MKKCSSQLKPLKQIKQGLLILSVIFVLQGCSLFGTKDETLPPMGLTAIKSSVLIHQQWSLSAGDGTDDKYLYLEPAYANDRIVTADANGEIMSFTASSGKKNWETDLNVPVTSGVGIGDDLVLVGTAKGEVLALSAETGELHWRSYVSSSLTSSPHAASGIVVAHTEDGNLFGLDEETGKEIWAYDGQNPSLTLRGSSPPVVAQNHIIMAFQNGRIAIFNLEDGRKMWEQVLAQPRGRSELERLVDINGGVVEENGIIYAVSYQGKAAAINITEGQPVWQHDMSSYRPLAVSSDAVYISDEQGVVWALDKRTGDTLWKQEGLLRRQLSGPAVWDNLVLVGDYDGYLHVLDGATGAIIGRERVVSEGIDAKPLIEGDSIYILGREGRLVSIKLSVVE